MISQRDIRPALRSPRLPTGGPVEWRAFELASNFSAGVASAYPRYFNAGVWQTLVDPSLKFDVVDPFDPSRYEGRYHGQFAYPHDGGSVGVARRPSDALQWEVMILTPVAEYIGGDLTVGSGGALEITSPVILGAVGAILLEHPAGPIAIEDDLFGWEPTLPGKAVAVRRAGVWQLLLIVPLPKDKVQ